MVTIEDPLNVATAATSFTIGTEDEVVERLQLGDNRFPVTITLFVDEEGARIVVSEAFDASGVRVGRGRASVAFEGSRTGSAVIRYGKPCETSDSCSDGDPCNGTETCQTGICILGEARAECAPSWDATVLIGLGEGRARAQDVHIPAPVSVAFDERGNMFVVDIARAQLFRQEAATGEVVLIAGNGRDLLSDGDGRPATQAGLFLPQAVAVAPNGDVFIGEFGGVRRIDAQTNIIETVIGGGLLPPLTGMAGTDVFFVTASSLGFDRSGRLLASSGAAAFKHQLFRLEEDGTITHLAGDLLNTNPTDTTQPALTAALGSVGSVVVDANDDIFLTDGDFGSVRVIENDASTIRPVVQNLARPIGLLIDSESRFIVSEFEARRVVRVDRDQNVEIIAGTGAEGFEGDGGPAGAAQLNDPSGLAFDGALNLYVADRGNGRVRRVTTPASSDSAIETVLGPGAAGNVDGVSARSLPSFPQDMQPLQLTFDATGTPLVAVGGSFNQVWRIEDGLVRILAGASTAEGALEPLDGLATSAFLNGLVGIAERDGELYVSETNSHWVRKISQGRIERLLGDGTPGNGGVPGPLAGARLSTPTRLRFDSQGRLLIVDSGNNRVVRVDEARNVVEIVAEGLSAPTDVIESNGALYISERGAPRVVRIDGGNQETIAGNGTAGACNETESAKGACLKDPVAIALSPGGDLLIADTATAGIVWEVDLGQDRIRRWVGGGTNAGDGNDALDLALDELQGLTVDGVGNIYVSTRQSLALPPLNRVWRIDASTRIASTLLGNLDPLGDGAASRARLGAPSQFFAMDPERGDDLLIADGTSGTVRRVDLDAGRVFTTVGVLGGLTAQNVQSAQSRLLRDARGLAFDPATRALYVTEFDGHTIRRIDTGSEPWTIETVAGRLDEPGAINGAGPDSRFFNPSGLSFDSASRKLYIADAGNNLIRRMDADTFEVETFAGNENGAAPAEDIAATSAKLNAPEGVLALANGNVFIAETGAHRVKRVDPTGIIVTVTGTGEPITSASGAPANQFPIEAPWGLAADESGNLYVTARSAVRLVAAEDGVATKTSSVSTVYGTPPKDDFPENVTNCLTGILPFDDPPGELAGRILLVDRCLGFLIRLDRTQ